ncbi:3985_t:CDS:2, partial [Racocetra persica]
MKIIDLEVDNYENEDRIGNDKKKESIIGYLRTERHKPVEHEVLGYTGEAFDAIEDFTKSPVESKDLSADQTEDDVE